MGNTILRFMSFIFVTSLCWSCSKDVASYEEIDDSAAGNTVLRVKTRAADGSDASVSSPINIYVFDSKDKCVAYNKIGSAGSDASFKLAAGDYKVYSVAGADAATYDIPTMENATIESVVSLKADKNHGDLMTAQNQVTLQNDIDSDVPLAMERKVLMLSGVTVNDVPDDITSITASISPLYENIRLDGEYSGKTGSITVELEKSASSSKWENQCNLYILPSVGNPLIKFTFKSSDGTTKTFTYLGKKPLSANYKVSMNVNYVKVKEPTLKCIITGVAWNENEEWSFDANEKDFSTDDGNTEEPTPDESEDNTIPKIGELYKGCLVLKAETNSNITTLTLVAPEQKNGLTYTTGNQESMKSSIDAAITELSVEGIDGWTLPTIEELKYVYNNIDFFNSKLKENGLKVFYKTSYKYYGYDNDGNIKCLVMNSAMTIKEGESGNTAYYLRPFATVKITK